MASNFKVWVEQSNISNVQSQSDFENDTQRQNGFQAGDTASAKRVNSGLRQANLVIAALMDLVDGSTPTLNLTSTVGDVSTAISNYLSGLTVAKASNADITSESANDDVIKFKIGSGTGYQKTINNVANANKATEADYASSDHSKGTIEQRLTNLGFKTGSFNLDSNKVTATLNELKRQGNYIIGELDVVIMSKYGGALVGTIPSDFLPKENVTIRGTIFYSYDVPFKTYNYCDVEIELNTNGNINATKLVQDSYGLYSSNPDRYARTHNETNVAVQGDNPIKIVFGYEASPIV